ncbi:Myb-like DNA-binding domain containing protein [Trichomonas vaginalis G3]|uniref:Myb-like DNA-binding domain containing protein n=1 Tax=Trichomonas vaginalis (strain ATCC PRA-98 / G3) TaxID=412133 RepID=A2G0V5_TRIV3|nr:RNA polymerase II transcription regulator recruiting protein [Trichomonas vaginalis G3]EAX89221.1 Myb-like DNA-binding domain containing protein [Trichomonas vaginalis G3]KAI5527477.1 RNA polymerase II transcription regulator recruiting protein [Trichomonas vaginalis G3]|eukprot:XP_001302151.1 Myb-like DNA-binding domain containing protein [Trichomonas vaginalis G3]
MSVTSSAPMAPTRTRQRNNVSTKFQKWTPEEDAELTSLVQGQDKVNWNEIAKHFHGKSSQQILERWTKVLDPTLMKGSWTRQEDETIINFVKQKGTKSWTKLAELLPGRIGKQCRERWINHLDPDINRGPWSPEEDLRLMELHSQFGNKWVKIASLMPHRSDNSIKNRWNSTLCKRSQMMTPESQKSVKFVPKSAEDMPRPSLLPDDDQSWTQRSFTPLGTIGLISPLAPNGSPFTLQSPISRMGLVSPWIETPKSLFASPMKGNNNISPSLSESRQELTNLIMKQ